jgi:pimeloyl-ACP methyl ester carboxylesterase
VASVAEHTGAIDELPVFWRSAPSEGTPILYLHGVPDNADVWTAFLERGGGLAIDLPGYGRSGKPGHFDYTIDGYDRFLERFLDFVEVPRVRMVVHDWGAVGLALAQRRPERVERLVIVNAVPLLPGYRWHRLARLWRTPIAGELAMGATSRRVMRMLSREANFTPGPMPEAFLSSVAEHFDPGTQRAILRLYRASPGERLAAAGAALGRLDVPALVLWGDADPYIPASFADAYARTLPRAELEHVAEAGHWPWIDRPQLVDRVVEWCHEFASGP